MKVAIVQETIDARRGGAETSTLEMARHLAGLGLEVTILCRAASADLPAAAGVAVVPLESGGLPRALRTYRFLQAVHRLHPRDRFDIVHAVTPCLAANVYQPRGGTYAETIARNLALTAADELRWLKALGRRFNLRQSFLLRMERTLLCKRREQVFVAAVSDYVRRQVIQGYGFPAERTRVVFNGVDIAPLPAREAAAERAWLRGSLGLAAEAPLVLFVAHNFKLKGLAELIRACAYSAGGACDRPGTAPAAADEPANGSQTGPKTQPPWSLVVAGRDQPRSYRRLARHLGVADRVHFVGTDTPIRHWYAAADLLAHPTWYDPCSRVVLEALSLGLPVVTTRYNGAAEVLEPGRHGEVIGTAGDIAALAAAVEKSLAATVRATCQADADSLRARLSMARHAGELKALYREVLTQSSRR